MSLQHKIAAALAQFREARTGETLMDAERLRDVATTTDGKVRLTFVYEQGDPPELARDIRKAVEGVDGVTEVIVDVVQQRQEGRATMPRKPLPVMDNRPAQPARPSAPTPVAYENLGRIIAVSSGKGGVGKSTVATNLAVALAKQGARVGLMDADIYGPNVPRMMGVHEPPPVINERIMPLEAHGVKFISLGVLIDRDQPAIWRGPIVMKIITQFLKDVAWGDLDYFFVDMPPGTGDAQLSLVQATHVSGAIIVTTPQEVATGDALRGAKMFQRVGVPVLGIVENMSWFECPHCGKPTALFGSGGGERLAKELELPLLGQIPMHPRVVPAGDEGTPIVVSDPATSTAVALVKLAERVAEAAAPAAAAR